MKITFFIYAIGLLISCTDSNNEVNVQKSSDSADNSITAARRKSMKGWELYSWMDKDWKFVLVPGTNRRKSADEIFSNKHIINGIKELEKEISKLENEQIIIISDGNQLKKSEISGPQFRKLTDVLLKQLVEICKRKNIQMLGIDTLRP